MCLVVACVRGVFFCVCVITTVVTTVIALSEEGEGSGRENCQYYAPTRQIHKKSNKDEGFFNYCEYT